MKKHLEKLQNKSDEQKTHIVRTAAFVVTGAIFILYLVIQAAVPDNVDKNSEFTQSSALEAFSGILNEGFSQLGSVGNQINSQGDQINLSPENVNLLNTQLQQDIIGDGLEIVNQVKVEVEAIEEPIVEQNVKENDDLATETNKDTIKRSNNQTIN